MSRCRRLVFLLLPVLVTAGCRDGLAPAPTGQASISVVVSGGTPVALVPSPSPAPTPTTVVVVTVRTPEPRPATPWPSAPPTTPAAALDEKLLPSTPTPAPTPTPPADPAERELWTLERAEADVDAGRHREALDRLDAGPVPADVPDLVALRKGELALSLGDRARGQAELSDQALARSSNRILLVRTAEAAERAELWELAGDFWTRASRQPTWHAERVRAIRSAAGAYARGGDPITAAERITQLADMEGKNPDPELVAALKENDALTAYHAGLMALIQGNDAEAGQKFRRYLAVAPGGPYAPAARDRLNRLNSSRPSGPTPWDAARRADTAEAYAAFRRAHPEHWQAPEALFREGFTHYRAGELDPAAETWSAATGPSFGAENRARALYWLGKVLSEQGRSEAARERWSQAASLRPSNYYTIRSADRLNGVAGWPAGGAVLPAAQPSPDEEVEALRWLDTWAGQAGPEPAEQAAIDRAVKFARVGLERTAGAELDALIETTRNGRVVHEAGRHAVGRGLWLSAIRAGRRLGQMSPDKTVFDAPPAIRRMAYPTGYADLVIAESARRDLGPLLLLALIRQESLFDRYARSTADARGLTQVLPSTGVGLARAAGRASFTAEDLYDPVTSVDFGARFLSGQLDGFRGDVFRAVAAYNAGANGANRWARGVDDPDVFVESIDYAETRAYVKAVYTHHAAYRSLVAR
jgi:soluble lytic murein transglycosylase